MRLLLATAAGGAVRRDAFNNAWRQAVVKAGMTPDRDATGTHQLRHRYAFMLLAGGVDVRTLAEYLGHSDPSITLRTYSHLLPSAADRARRAVEEALSADHGDGPSTAQKAD